MFIKGGGNPFLHAIYGNRRNGHNPRVGWNPRRGSSGETPGSAARPRGGQLSELTELHPSSILICGFPARIRRGEEQDAAALSTRRRRQRGGSATAAAVDERGTVPPVQYCPLISWNQAFGLVIIITTQTR